MIVLINGLIDSLINGLIDSLINGLIDSLINGLIDSLINGLIDCFEVIEVTMVDHVCADYVQTMDCHGHGGCVLGVFSNLTSSCACFTSYEPPSCASSLPSPSPSQSPSCTLSPSSSATVRAEAGVQKYELHAPLLLFVVLHVCECTRAGQCVSDGVCASMW